MLSERGGRRGLHKLKLTGTEDVLEMGVLPEEWLHVRVTHLIDNSHRNCMKG